MSIESLCSLRQLSVAKTPLQLFHYLLIVDFWSVKLGRPACEHPAQIFFRNAVDEILVTAELLIFEFKFCPV